MHTHTTMSQTGRRYVTLAGVRYRVIGTRGGDWVIVPIGADIWYQERAGVAGIRTYNLAGVMKERG